MTILDSFKVLNGFSFHSTFINTMAMFYQPPVYENHELFLKIIDKGLYHITSNENADKILKDKVLNPTKKFIPYAYNKVHFFAGIPSFDILACNLTPKLELTAIKIKPTYEQLAKFNCRKEYDNAVIYSGECKLDDMQVEKVKLYLNCKDGKMFYDIKKDKIDTINEQSWKKNVIVELKGYLQAFKLSHENFMKFLKDERDGVKTKMDNLEELNKTENWIKNRR